MQLKSPQDGYVRCEALMPVLSCQMVPIPEMPTRRVLGLLTEDGALALGVSAESAQLIADFLGRSRSRHAQGIVTPRVSSSLIAALTA